MHMYVYILHIIYIVRPNSKQIFYFVISLFRNPMELLEEFRDDKQLNDFLRRSDKPTMQKKWTASNKTRRVTGEWCTTSIQQNVDDCFSWLKKQELHGILGKY